MLPLMIFWHLVMWLGRAGGGAVLLVSNADNPLWQFSLQFYALPDVARACLHWQEAYDADVNILLLCCWCSMRGFNLDALAVEELNAESVLRDWRRDVLVPLRAARIASRHGDFGGALRDRQVIACYQSLKAAELQAERLEQAYLWRWLHFQGASFRDSPHDRHEGNQVKVSTLACVEDALQHNVVLYGRCLAVVEVTERMYRPFLTGLRHLLENPGD